MSDFAIPTFQDFFDAYVAEAKRRVGLQGIDPEMLDFVPGSMLDLFGGGASTLADQNAWDLARRFAATYVDTAEGDKLTRLALDHYGIVRFGAVPAMGTARFSRPNTAFGDVLIDTGTLVGTLSDPVVQFVTTAPVTLSGVTADAPIAAAIAGSGSIVALGTLTTLLSTLADTSITISNPERTAGGMDVEDDDALRRRVHGFFQTLRRGTIDALKFGAKQIPGVVRASVDESQGLITRLYVADIEGGANSALVQAVASEITNWRAAGKIVNVYGATVVLQSITIHLAFAAGVDTALVRNLAVAAIAAAVNGLAIGETLYASSIVAAARGIQGIVDCKVIDPAGDVVPTADQILRTNAGLIGVTT